MGEKLVKDALLQIKIERSFHERLNAAAGILGMSMSALVRAAVVECADRMLTQRMDTALATSDSLFAESDQAAAGDDFEKAQTIMAYNREKMREARETYTAWVDMMRERYGENFGKATAPETAKA